jgi:hypothetical protein
VLVVNTQVMFLAASKFVCLDIYVFGVSSVVISIISVSVLFHGVFMINGRSHDGTDVLLDTVAG